MEHARFLGVYIDEKLQWNEHINQISVKVSKIIGMLKKISHLLSTSVLLQLYNTLVLPYLNYYNMIWTAASESIQLTGLTKQGCMERWSASSAERTSSR